MSHRIASILAALVLALASTARADLVTDWNQAAIQAAKTAGLNANKAPRALAIFHIAIHDALAAIDKSHAPYQTELGLTVEQPTSREAAVHGAAHYVLSALFPAQKPALTAKLAALLAALPDSSAAKKNGVELGVAAADGILSARAADGALAVVEYKGSEEFGQWRPTTPGVPAVDPQWASLLPFALESPDALRPAAPPGPGEETYETDLSEVRVLGGASSTAATSVTRSGNQTEIAKFWEFATHLPFNAIARQLAQQKGLSLADSARLFAHLNIALADTRIAAADAKYHYGSWRPVTALNWAEPVVESDAGVDADGGVEDAGAPSEYPIDAEWKPYLTTPAHPDYPSGHSTTGAAGAAVLAAWFGDEVPFSVSSESLPETTRAFTSLWQAAVENGRSRIYGGIHFQFANVAGLNLGKAVGQLVVATLLQPLAPAEQPDAGVLEDAGATESDAGVLDAGDESEPAPEDAGAPPEEPVDAGQSSDPDAGAGADGDGDGDAEEEEDDADGCSVSHTGNAGSSFAGLLFLALASWLVRRRRV